MSDGLGLLKTTFLVAFSVSVINGQISGLAHRFFSFAFLCLFVVTRINLAKRLACVAKDALQ